MNRIQRFSDIDNFIKEYPDAKNGCLVDTNALVAASFGAHEFAEDSEFIFEKLADHKVPIYCNVNIRAEFLEYARRLLITEGLLTIRAQAQSREIAPFLKTELGKIRNLQKKSEDNNRLYRLTDGAIKKIRRLIENDCQGAWSSFCKEFLTGALENEWQKINDSLGLNYLELRNQDTSKVVPLKVTWKSMVELMEKTGAASNDAMVLNLLDKSIPIFLVTTDSDFAFNINSSKVNKFVFLPQNHSYWS